MQLLFYGYSDDTFGEQTQDVTYDNCANGSPISLQVKCGTDSVIVTGQYGLHNAGWTISVTPQGCDGDEPDMPPWPIMIRPALADETPYSPTLVMEVPEGTKVFGLWGDQLPDSKLRATMTNDYTSLEQAEIAKLRARLELIASQLNAAWSKRDDAPASAESHLQEASFAVFAFRKDKLGPEASALRARIWESLSSGDLDVAMWFPPCADDIQREAKIAAAIDAVQARNAAIGVLIDNGWTAHQGQTDLADALAEVKVQQAAIADLVALLKGDGHD